ncbi:hypothetical protein HY404_01365 [Candidatus Microgenomates bacterium]|nr:hypothetical protein [Candidatus Microgenomates bacterium]
MRRHFSHYLVLLGILIIVIAGFKLFSFDRPFQIALVVASSLAYISWGIVHHWIHSDLYWEVVIEYTAIALLGSALILSLLL